MSKSKRSKRKERLATPREVLQATIFCIKDGAKTRPANNLVGTTPADTIAACRRIIRSIVVPAASPEGIVITNADILRMVVGALYHAEDEAKSLWTAAEKMVNSLEVRRA